MRTLGQASYPEFEPDPSKAWRRARRLDAMLQAGLPRPPRGITRGTHEALARQDELRSLDAARRINV